MLVVGTTVYMLALPRPRRRHGGCEGLQAVAAALGLARPALTALTEARSMERGRVQLGAVKPSETLQGSLLPRRDSATAAGGGAEGQSALAAAFTLIKCNWGIGMMAMPYMLDQAGTVTGVIIFVVSMALTQFSISRLLDAGFGLVQMRRLGRENRWSGKPVTVDTVSSNPEGHLSDYTAIIMGSLGPLGEWAALASIVLSCWGSCIAYLLFIGKNMNNIFGHGEHFWTAVACAPLLMLSLLDDIRFLAPSSVFGLTCSLGFAVLVVVEVISHLLDNPHELHEFFQTQPLIKPATMPLALSLAAFCNEGIVILSPSTRSSMRRPDQFLTVTGLSIVYFTICYMAVGFLGNVRYAGHVQGQLALNIDISHGSEHMQLNRIAIVLYCVQLIPTYAVVYFCA